MLKVPEMASTELRGVSLLPPPRKMKDARVLRTRKYLHLLRQLTCFGLVGGLNTLLDILAFNVLLFLFPTTNALRLVAFNALAYCVGAGNSFVCNKYWTFQHSRRTSRRELLRFATTTSLGMAFNSSILWLAGLALHSLQINTTLWANVAKILAISATMLISYLGMRLWVFASRVQPGPARASR